MRTITRARTFARCSRRNELRAASKYTAKVADIPILISRWYRAGDVFHETQPKRRPAFDDVPGT